MKRQLIISAMVVLLSASMSAQESTIKNGMGFGFQLNQYQKDFGLGLNITSPFFSHQSIAVRLRGNLMFYEHVSSTTGEVVWTPYSNISLGLIGVGGMVGEFIRVYGEGGIIYLIPNSEFSSETGVVGGYGMFGFEFFMAKSVNYFIEIGGVGSGALADKVPTKPIYSNGLLITAGFRFTL